MNLEIVRELLTMLKTNEGAENNNNFAALATVIKSSGSAPREDGACMLIKETGEIVGTIGGGIVEKKVIEKSLALMGKNSRVLRSTFDLSNQEVAQTGGVCGGKVEVLLEIINLQKGAADHETVKS